MSNTKMPSNPGPRPLRQSLRASREHRVIYLNNPKAGCSTVKASLWRAMSGEPAGNIHALEGSPFSNRIIDADWVADAFIFTFVRNPFVRIVSCYVNKIAARKDNIWPSFARRHGLDVDDRLGFDGFVECISADPPQAHDPHWRAQTINTLAAHVTPNFTGALENMDTELPRVLAHVFPDVPAGMDVRSLHRTGADQHCRDFLKDRGTLARVQDIYAPDFENFGYAPGLSAAFTPVRERTFRDHRHPDFAESLRRSAETGS